MQLKNKKKCSYSLSGYWKAGHWPFENYISQWVRTGKNVPPPCSRLHNQLPLHITVPPRYLRPLQNTHDHPVFLYNSCWLLTSVVSRGKQERLGTNGRSAAWVVTHWGQGRLCAEEVPVKRRRSSSTSQSTTLMLEAQPAKKPAILVGEEIILIMAT